MNLSVHKRSKLVNQSEFSNGIEEVFWRSFGGFSVYTSQSDVRKYSIFPFNKLQHSLAEHAYFLQPIVNCFSCYILVFLPFAM